MVVSSYRSNSVSEITRARMISILSFRTSSRSIKLTTGCISLRTISVKETSYLRVFSLHLWTVALTIADLKLKTSKERGSQSKISRRQGLRTSRSRLTETESSINSKRTLTMKTLVKLPHLTDKLQSQTGMGKEAEEDSIQTMTRSLNTRLHWMSSLKKFLCLHLIADMLQPWLTAMMSLMTTT